VAVEFDRGFIPVLQDLATQYPNLTIKHADILKCQIQDLVGDKPYKLVANIPYYLTSALTRMFLQTPSPPQLIVLLVAKELAQKMQARPPQHNLLACSIQYFAELELLATVPANCFYPAPQVASALIKLYPKPTIYERPPIYHQALFDLIKIGYSQKRKRLAKLLAAAKQLPIKQVETALHNCGLDPTARAQQLGIEEWENLHETLALH